MCRFILLFTHCTFLNIPRGKVFGKGESQRLASLWNWDSILGYLLDLIGLDRYRQLVIREVELHFNIKIRNVREHQGLKKGKCPILITVGNICEPFDSNSYDESLLSSYTTDWAWISTSKKEHVFFYLCKKGLAETN